MNSSSVRFLRGLLLVSGLAVGVSCNGPQAAVPTTSHIEKDEPKSLNTAKVAALPVAANLFGTNASDASAWPRPVVEPSNMSAGLVDVVKLAKGGVNEDVMLAFVQQTTNAFALGPDELLYLTDIGVGPEVITAMQRKASPLPTPKLTASTPPSVELPHSPAPAPVAPALQVVTPEYVQPGPVAGVVAPAPQPAPTVIPVVVQDPNAVPVFQDALTPHGVWVDVPGYGRCWQPNYAVLPLGWRPYQDGGRWVWSDYGWYWVSDYPWGWATFHYGRWFSTAGLGWVWAPDTVWGPSWVCWRRTTSHCGWAPLPPGAYFSSGGWYHHGRHVDFEFGFGIGAFDFAFLPWGRFCDPHPHHFYASGSHVSGLYHQSVVVNNTVVGNNNTVIFQGAGKAPVVQASRSPIPQAALRETAWAGSSKSASEQIVHEKSGFVITSPRVPSGAPARPGPASGSGRTSPTAASGSIPSQAPVASLAGDSGAATAFGAGVGFAAGRSAFDPSVGRASVAIPSTRSASVPVASSLPSRSAAVAPAVPRAPITQPSAPVPALRSAPAAAAVPPLPVRQAGSSVSVPTGVATPRPLSVSPPIAATAASVPAAIPIINSPSLSSVAPRPVTTPTVSGGAFAPTRPTSLPVAPAAAPISLPRPSVSAPSAPAPAAQRQTPTASYSPAPSSPVRPVYAPFVPGPPAASPATIFHSAPPAYSGSAPGNSPAFRSPPPAAQFSAPPSRPVPTSVSSIPSAPSRPSGPSGAGSSSGASGNRRPGNH